MLVSVGPSPSGVCGGEDMRCCVGFGDLFLLVLTLVFLFCFGFFFFNLQNPVSGLSPLLNETIWKSCRFLALSGIRKALIAGSGV